MVVLGVLAVVAITFIGAVIQGSVGFGLGLVVVPVLALVDPDLVPVVPMVAALPLAGYVAFRDRDQIEFSQLGWAWVGRLPGTVIGAWLLSVLSGTVLEATFAVLILVAVGLAARRGSPRTGPAVMASAGVASGIMATAVSTGGPPMVLVMLDLPPARLRASLNAFFFLGGLVSLLALFVVGRTSWVQLGVVAALLPAVGLGLVVADRWGTTLDPATVRRVALGLASTAAVVLLGSAVL